MGFNSTGLLKIGDASMPDEDVLVLLEANLLPQTIVTQASNNFWDQWDKTSTLNPKDKISRESA